MATKNEAINRLRAAGFENEADELEAWRNNYGNNQGWDGSIRRRHPHVIHVIWPDE